MKGIQKHAWIDYDRESYSGFFDHEWAKLVNSRVRGRSSLDVAVFDLLLAWKSVSNAFRFPWLLPQFHEGFVNGFTRGEQGAILGFVKDWRALLAGAARGPEDLPGLELAMNLADDATFNSMTKRDRTAKDNLAATTWKAYLGEPEFSLAVLGLMAQTYTGLMFAYEHFVLKCHRILSPECKMWTTSKDFKNAFASSVGSACAEQCWNGDDMLMRRTIRNAIAHNGGKYNNRLDRWKDQLHVIDDELQISATENRLLYSFLQTNVNVLVDAVLERVHAVHE